MMKLIWIPLKSVGPFQFNDRVEKYIKTRSLEYIPDKFNDEQNWQQYKLLDSDTNLYAENKKITSIHCSEFCIFNDTNLIGLPLNQIIKLLRTEPEDFVDTIDMPDGSVQKVYEFDDLEVQVWVEKGIVVCVVCRSPDEDEQEEN